MTNNLNLTPRAQSLMKDCVTIATELGHEQINCFHLLLSFLNLGEAKNQINKAFSRFQIKTGTIRNEILAYLKSSCKSKELTQTPILDKDCKSILKAAKSISNKYDHKYVGVEHIFICIFEVQNEKFLNFLGKIQSFEGVIDYIEKGLEEEDSMTESNVEGAEKDQQPQTDKKTLIANSICLNEQVLTKKIHSLHINEKQIRKISEILCRRNKNNPLIVGEAGVGKTALVECLALSIVEGKCSDFIAGKQIYALDVPMIIAGCKYRGEFEEKIKNILKEAQSDPNVILFIDEIHTIIGAGNPENGMDIANILKPYLARGEISCIGATTFDEYKNTIADDPALNRRFQLIKLEEPSKEETLELAKTIKSSYEDFHFVSYSDDVLKNMIDVAERYISGRFPDKVLDLIDQTGAKAKLSLFKKNKKMAAIEKKIKSIINKHSKSPNDENLVHIELLIKKYETESVALITRHQTNKYCITQEDVLTVVSDKTGIPIEELNSKDVDKLKCAKQCLEDQIIGQKSIIDQIYKSLLRAKAGFRNPKRPIISYLFAGPTGVGKTFSAKILSEKLYSNKNAFVHLDMAEYADKTAINKLIGSSPGYIGSDKGGVLTEKIRKNPYSIILFDEVQKADVDVLSCILQILEEGRITDSFGTNIDFTNCVIIITTNVGGEVVNTSSIGFSEGSSVVSRDVLAEIRRFFASDFLNRIDEVVIFNKLTEANILDIFDKRLKEIAQDLHKKGIALSYSEDVKNHLYKQVQFANFGARQVDKTLQREVHTILAEKILENSDSKKLEITVTNGALMCK